MSKQLGWRVLRNGVPLGIVETNYQWARPYWQKRAQQDGSGYRLEPYYGPVFRQGRYQ